KSADHHHTGTFTQSLRRLDEAAHGANVEPLSLFVALTSCRVGTLLVDSDTECGDGRALLRGANLRVDSEITDQAQSKHVQFPFSGMAAFCVMRSGGQTPRIREPRNGRTRWTPTAISEALIEERLL